MKPVNKQLGLHLHIPSKPKEHRGIDIGKQALKTLHTSPAQATNDDEDLVEVHECKECRYELKSQQDYEWGLCPSHMPNFDAAFTADEQELYMGKHNGGAMAVGFVRRINQLELLIDNLQEQIIELSKGDK